MSTFMRSVLVVCFVFSGLVLAPAPEARAVENSFDVDFNEGEDVNERVEGTLEFHGPDGFIVKFKDDGTDGTSGGSADGTHITDVGYGNNKAGSGDFVLGALNDWNGLVNFHSSGIVIEFNHGAKSVSLVDTDDDQTLKTLFAFDADGELIGQTDPGAQQTFTITTDQTGGELIYQVEFDTEAGDAGGSHDGTYFTIDDVHFEGLDPDTEIEFADETAGGGGEGGEGTDGSAGGNGGTAKSCGDGFKNGTETGTDCGGNCRDCGTDLCIDAPVITPTGTYYGGTGDGTNTNGEAMACTDGLAWTGPDLFYAFDMLEGDLVQITEMQEYGWDSGLYIFTDCGDPVGSCVAGCDTPCQLEYVAEAATTYYVGIDGATGQGGTYKLDMTRDQRCLDGEQNYDETGVDCGGSCDACSTGADCNVGGDCKSGSCQAGTCASSSCDDNVINGDESDTDCGGAIGPVLDDAQAIVSPGDGDYTSIQDAINSSNPGDTIVVKSGTYNEGGVSDGYGAVLYIPHALTIIGAGPDAVTVESDIPEDAQRTTAIAFGADSEHDTRITGMTFVHNQPGTDGDTRSYTAVSDHGNGEATGSIFIDHVVFRLAENHAKCMLHSADVVDKTFENIVVDFGSSNKGQLTYVDTLSAESEIFNSIVYQTDGNSVFQGVDQDGPQITTNYSIFYGPETTPPGQGNKIDDPLFEDAAGNDYQLKTLSPAIDSGSPAQSKNDDDGSRNDMGAYGGDTGDQCPACGEGKACQYNGDCSTSFCDESVCEVKRAVVTSLSSDVEDDTYGPGATIPVIIRWDEKVEVTGTPVLVMETGTTDREAYFMAGSGTKVLEFFYVVEAGDSSSDLDVVDAASLLLKGGTISSGGVAADLDIPAPGGEDSLGLNKDIVIDGDASGEAVDLCAWSQAGPASAGNWDLADDCQSVYQTINGDPTYFISDFNIADRSIEGKFKQGPNDGDDDFMGFVFGWQDVDHHYVFDWKKGNQSGAQAGTRLMVLTGPNHDLWAGTGEDLEVLASDYSNGGWVSDVTYRFKLEFHPGSIDIDVFDDATDEKIWTFHVNDDTYTNGQAGFYNYSQSRVRYQSFTLKYTAPTLDPSEGDQGETLTATINGEGFQDGSVPDFGVGISVGKVKVVNSTALLCNLEIDPEAPLGGHEVSVLTGDVTQVLDTKFTVHGLDGNDVEIYSLNPSSVAGGGSFTIEVSGKNFPVDPTLSTTSEFLDIQGYEVVSAKEMLIFVVVAPNPPVGTLPIKVESPVGESATGFLEIFGISDFIPAVLDLSDGATATVTGFGFSEGMGLDLGPGVTVTNLEVLSSTTLTADLYVESHAPLGPHDASVTSGDGGALLEDALTVVRTGVDLGATYAISHAGGETHLVSMAPSNEDVNDTYIINQPQPAFSNHLTGRLHRNPDESVWAVMVLDTENDGSGGSFAVEIDSDPGADWKLCDDPNECTSFDDDGFCFNTWAWGDCCADGGIFGPLGTKKCTSIETLNFQGLDVWRFLDENDEILADYPVTGVLDICPSYAGEVKPNLSSVEPSDISGGETVELTLTGSNFEIGTRVDLGEGITVTNVEAVTNLLLKVTAVADAGAEPGARDVVVSTGSGSAVKYDGLAVYGISDVSPDTVKQSETVQLTVTGGTFVGDTLVELGQGLSVQKVDIVDAGTLLVTVRVLGNAMVGPRDAEVLLANGRTLVRPNAIQVVDEVGESQPIPTVFGTSPAGGKAGQTRIVNVLGDGFVKTLTADFGPFINVANCTTITAETAACTIIISADAVLGSVDVSVTTNHGTGIGEDVFSIVELGLTAVEPASVSPAYSGWVTLTGNDFTNDLTANFGAGISVEEVLVSTESTADVYINVDGNYAPGFVTIIINNGSDQRAASDLFSIQELPPSIASVVPAYISPGTTRLLGIYGDNLTPETSYATSAGTHTVAATNWLSINEAEMEYTAPLEPQMVDWTVTGSAGSGFAAGATTIYGASDIAVIPIAPGRTVDMEISGYGFQGDETFDAGAGVTLSEIEITENAIFCKVSAADDAPIGPHDLLIESVLADASHTVTGGLEVLSNPNSCGPDTDGDGLVNAKDAFPLNEAETEDSDCDGVGDNTDSAPNDASCAGEAETCNGEDDDCDGTVDNLDGASPCANGCNSDTNTCIVCGNGILDPGEVCDDNNTEAGDNCSATCLSEVTPEHTAYLIAYINSAADEQWGEELKSRLQAAGANVTYSLNPPAGAVDTHLADNDYDQLWLLDLHSGGLEYAVDAQAIADFHSKLDQSNAIIDARIKGDLEHPPHAAALVENYYTALAEHGGGVAYLTGHSDYCQAMFNLVMSLVGYEDCTGKYDGSYLIDNDSPVLATPNNLTLLYNTASAGNVAVGGQETGDDEDAGFGDVLYPLAWQAGDIDSAVASTTIEGLAGFHVEIVSPAPLSEHFPNEDILFEATYEGSTDTVTFTWESDLDGTVYQPAPNSGDGQSVTKTLPSDGLHTITVTAKDPSGRMDRDTVQITVKHTDVDGDGVSHTVDNCPDVANEDQLDTDQDTVGDLCDFDDDNDGICDSQDTKPQSDNNEECKPEVDDNPGEGVNANPSDLVCAYYLNDGDGVVAADASGNGYNGQVLGSATWVQSSLSEHTGGPSTGSALDFPAGGDGSVVAPFGSLMDVVGGWTIETWLKVSEVPQNKTIIAGRKTPSGLPLQWLAAKAAPGGGGGMTVYAELRKKSGTYVTINDEISDTDLDGWHHLAAVFNGTALILYVDGQDVKNVAALGLLADGEGDFEFGGVPGTYENVALWSTGHGPLAINDHLDGTLEDADGDIAGAAIPAIDGVSPNVRGGGQSATLTITGANFAQISDIDFGSGITVDAIHPISVTECDVDITIDTDAAVGNRNVTVETGEGVTTFPNAFTVFGITGISPSVVVLEGTNLEVGVAGAGFSADDTFDFGGNVTITNKEFIHQGEWHFLLDVDENAVLGSRDVTATNDEDGNGADTVFSGVFSVTGPDAITWTSTADFLQSANNNVVIGDEVSLGEADGTADYDLTDGVLDIGLTFVAGAGDDTAEEGPSGLTFSGSGGSCVYRPTPTGDFDVNVSATVQAVNSNAVEVLGFGPPGPFLAGKSFTDVGNSGLCVTASGGVTWYQDFDGTTKYWNGAGWVEDSGASFFSNAIGERLDVTLSWSGGDLTVVVTNIQTGATTSINGFPNPVQPVVYVGTVSELDPGFEPQSGVRVIHEWSVSDPNGYEDSFGGASLDDSWTYITGYDGDGGSVSVQGGTSTLSVYGGGCYGVSSPTSSSWTVDTRVRVNSVNSQEVAVLGMGDGSIFNGNITDAPGTVLFATSGGALGWCEVRGGTTYYWDGGGWTTNPTTIPGTENSNGSWWNVNCDYNVNNGLSVELYDESGALVNTIVGFQATETAASFLGSNSRYDSLGNPQDAELEYDLYDAAGNVSGSGYQSTGTITPSPYDAGDAVNWGTFGLGAKQPAGTEIRCTIRTGDSLDELEGKAFTGPDGLASSWFGGGEVIDGAYDHTRFIQWSCDLLTSDPALTCELYDVVITRQELPTIVSMSPEYGKRGKEVEVLIEGTNFDSGTTVDLGPNVIIDHVDVLTVTYVQAYAIMEDVNAPGPRDVVLTTTAGSVDLPDGFGMAGILDTETKSGAQGQDLEVTLLGIGLEPPASVDMGEQISTGTPTVPDTSTLQVQVEIGEEAAIGPRPVFLTSDEAVTSKEDAFEVTAEAICGDGIHQRGEACDDGNTDSGDECLGDCSALDIYQLVETAPVGLWRFDGTLADDSGNGHDGVAIGGAAFAAGYRSQACDYDGTSGYVNVNGGGAFSSGAEATIQVWMRSLGVQSEDLFTVVDKSHGCSDSTGWTLQGDTSDGTVTFNVGKGGPGSSDFVGATSTTPVDDGDWHHVVGVYTGYQVCIWVDGDKEKCINSADGFANNSRELNFGRWWNCGDGGRYFHGLTDEIAVWDVALGTDDIQSLYTGTLPGSECGNSDLEDGEFCDDGNALDNDGCSGDCTSYGLGISHVEPSTIATDGPTQVTVVGANFGTDLTINAGVDVEVSDVEVLSATTASAVFTPVEGCNCGKENLEISSGGVTVSKTAAYSVLSVYAVQGGALLVGAESIVTIEGEGFYEELDISMDMGQGITILGSNIIGTSRIEVEVSTGNDAYVGQRTLVVAVGGVQGVFDGFVSVAGAGTPTIDEVDPAYAAVDTTIPASLTGTGFSDGMTIDLGVGVYAKNVDVVSGTLANFDIQVASKADLGLRTLTATTSGGVATLPSALEIVEFTLEGIEPNEAPVGQDIVVTLKGFGFEDGLKANFGKGIEVNDLTVLSQGEAELNITLTYEAKGGLRNVKATLGGVESLLTAGFNVKWEPIEITDILPDTVSPSLEDTLNIVGAGFTSGEEVTVQSCETINTLFFNDTLLKPTILAGPNPGKYDVNVTNGGNDILIQDGITIFGITDVDPPVAEQGESVTLTFTGFGFRPPVPGQLAQQLELNAGLGTTSSNLQILTENTFSVDVTVGADSPTGVHIVKAIVEPEDLYQEFIGGFTVELPGGGLAAPAVSDISPSNALPGEEVTVTLSGSGFSETANVEFGDQVDVVDVETLSASSLVATIVLNDMAAPGTRDVSVFTDEGFVTITDGFTIDTPGLVVTGMVESNVFEKYETVTTTIEGEGFSTDTTAAASGGAQIIDVVPLSTTQLQVTWDATKNAGCFDLHVYNGDAENVSTAFFCVFGISGLSVAEGGKGDTITVPLSGGFPEGTDISVSSSVEVSDITILNNGNDAEATFAIEPLAVKGPRDVTVAWQGLSDTLEEGFIIKAGPPTITDIEPDVLEPGQTRVVTLKGYNFTNADVEISAEVVVNSVTFVNDARIDLDLTAGGLLGGVQLVLSGPGGANTYNDAIDIAIPDYSPAGYGQVTIEAPNNNASFTAAGGPVDLDVTFNVVDWVPSQDGIIKFFEDGEEVGSQMVLTPYTFNNLKSGQHSLTVGLFDDAGNLMNSDGSHDTIVVRVEGSCTVDADCEDNNPCSNFTCSAGTCKYGPTGFACCQTELDCASDEVCSSDNQCVKCENDVDCIDGVACTYERCLDNGTCLEENPEGCCITPADCDDGKSCTAEDCVDNTCVFVGEFADSIVAKAADARVHDAIDGTPTVDEPFASPVRVGKVNVDGQGGMGNLVIPFEIPELPDGHQFVSVDFQVRIFGSDMSAAKPFHGDLYALSRRLNPDVLAADFWAGEQDEYATLIQDDFLESGVANLSDVSLSGSARDTLLDFMNTQYKSGVGAGQYVFLRLSPDVGAIANCTQGALEMSGVVGSASRPDVTLDLDNDWTIESWVRPESYGEWRKIVEYGTGEELSFRIQLTQSGEVDCLFWEESDTTADNVIKVHSADPLPTDEWSHVAMVFDGGEMRCYVNGELSGTANGNSPGQKAVKESISICGDVANTGEYVFHGGLAYVHLNDKALYTGASYNLPTDMAPDGATIGFWPLNDGTGATQALDEGPNAYHLSELDSVGWSGDGPLACNDSGYWDVLTKQALVASEWPTMEWESGTSNDCCAADSDCEDGNNCTIERCIGGECRIGPISSCCNLDDECDDENPCTIDICDTATNSCSNVDAGIPNCCANVSDCFDGDPCTIDTCDLGANLCSNNVDPDCCNVDADCDDGIPCNNDRCIVGRCRFGPAFDFPECCVENPTLAYLECDDGNPCTNDACNPANFTCLYEDAGDAACCAESSECDDKDPATKDICSRKGECLYHPNPNYCDDDTDCDDGYPCSQDSCVLHTCVHDSIADCCVSNVQCNDGNTCTKDQCGDANVCVAEVRPNCCNEASECDDGDICTAESCEQHECYHEPIFGCCHDDSDCDDDDACTADICDGGTCQNPSSGECSDEGTGVLHTFDTTLEADGFTTDGNGNAWVGVDGWATLDVDVGPPVNFETRLVGPVVDASNANKLRLQFRQDGPRAQGGSNTAEVRITVNGGLSWTTVLTQTPFAHEGPFVSIDLSGLANNQGEVQVAFVWSGEGDSSDFFWGIDEVVLGAGRAPLVTSHLPPEIFAEPGDLLSYEVSALDLDTDEVVEFETKDAPEFAFMSGTGKDGLKFVSNLVVNPVDSDLGIYDMEVILRDNENLRAIEPSTITVEPPASPALCEPQPASPTTFNEPAFAPASCRELKDQGFSENGYYWIDPDGVGDASEVFQVFCEMQVNGGGWTMVANFLEGSQPAETVETTGPDDHFRLPYITTELVSNNASAVRFSCKRKDIEIYIDVTSDDDLFTLRPYQTGDGCDFGLLWKPDISSIEELKCSNFDLEANGFEDDSCDGRVGHQLDVYPIGLDQSIWYIGDPLENELARWCAGDEDADYMRIYYR